MGFPGSSAVINLPAVQEIWVPALSQEDALEKELATHASMLAWEIPWTEVLTNSCEEKRSEKQRKKGLIYPFECRVPKNSQER